MSMTANMNTVEMLTFALSERRSVASDPTRSVTIEVTADGAIHSIRLSDAGRRICAEQLVEMIKQLHATATAEAQQAVKDIVVGFDDDGPGRPQVAMADERTDFAERSPAVETSQEREVRSAEKAVASATFSPTPIRPPMVASAPLDAATTPTGISGRPADVISYDDEDEDEYYRNFSITQQDDYRPRSSRPDNR
ncbi:hypothetical protein ACQPW1_11395 [Nocardia sp. CA-128927]|uniref:hypothetical protein n=1 Tax=Nocardia sp. CA-128927 TaxID=3239975 RepID=UPI003D96D55D